MLDSTDFSITVKGEASNHSPTASEYFAELDSQLRAFDITRCEMKHEKVQRSNNGIDPLPCSLSGEGFKRFQYCSNAIRSKRLGCAHTTARIRMLQILDDLPTRVAPEKQIEQWKSIVQELEQSIIDVDRKKSDAELAHAIQSAEIQREATKKSEIQGKLANTAAHIAELIKTHNHYLDKLERLRNEVLDTLSHNKVLKTNKP